MMIRLGLGILMLLVTTATLAETMTLQQMLQKVVDHYPSLKTAALQVEKARQNSAQVQSQLGWQLGAQGGYDKNVSFFGAGVERIDVGGGLSKSLESGGAISIGANIGREESDESLIPNIANPSTTTSFDINYRKPLQKGADNLDYKINLENADISAQLATADKLAVYDQIATQIIEIYLAALNTRSRIENTKESVKRTQRLQDYIKSRFSLGIAEDKDQLQVIAQYDGQQAQLKALELLWVQQRISLNRLMGRKWDAPLTLPLPVVEEIPAGTLEEYFQEVKAYSPALQRINSQIQFAVNTIKSQREASKDDLDLVMYLGNRSITGDSAMGDADNSEVVGGLRVEYNHGIDRSGYKAAIYQAQLERGIALQNQYQIEEDLFYEVASLFAELKAVQESLQAYQKSLKSEQAKLKEATERYRRGRLQVDVLIQFEGQMSAAELALDLHRIETERRLQKLALLRGLTWRQVKLPEIDIASEYNKVDEQP